MSAVGAVKLDWSSLKTHVDAGSNVHYANASEIMIETQEGMLEIYGASFCDKVGIENLLKMKTVNVEDLKVTPGKYNRFDFSNYDFGPYSAVKFIDQFLRPGIAILLKGYDYWNERWFTTVEVIQKRYSLDGDGGKGKLHESNFVSAQESESSDGFRRESIFYRSGATYDFTKMKEALSGELFRTQLMYIPHGGPSNVIACKV
jgi:hypothetical protein